jgi:hypothetical protein
MASNSRDKQLQGWDTLLEEVRENQADLPGAAPFLRALERANDQAVSLRIRRDRLLASSRDATRELDQAFTAGREAASALRSFVKSVLGFRNEKLLGYGIKPVRRRGRGGL